MITGEALVRNTRRLHTASAEPERMALNDGGPLRIPEGAPKTLIEALLATAKKRPGRGIRFISVDGREVVQSYPQLLERAGRILTGLRQAGIQPRQGVILQVDTLDFHFASFWACVLGGMIPVTVAIPPSYRQKDGVVAKLYHTWKLLGGAPILTNTHLTEAVSGLEASMGMAGVKVLSVDESVNNEPSTDYHKADPAEPFFYQLTSGSTGVPKCIQEAHRSVIAHIHGSQQFCNYDANEVTLNWLPFDHVVPILTYHLRDVYLGYDQIHVKPDYVLANPGAWLELIEKYRVTLTWSPNFGFKRVGDYLKQNPDKKYDLRSVKYFMNAGEQVTGPVVGEFLREVERFGVEPTAMQPAFGMAEVCTCMTYTNDFSIACSPRRFRKSSLAGKLEEVRTSSEQTTEFVDLGGPIPGVAIRIANSKNEVVPERVIGRLQIKGAVVTPGYLHNPSANEEAFVGEGWFNTGDLGFMLNGRLFLTGREKEMIVIRGSKFYCYEIEDVVNGVTGVEPTFAAACSALDPAIGTEALTIFFVPKTESEGTEIAQKIREKVTAAFGIAPGAVVPLTRSTFLKTTSGKIQRTQMKKNLENGQYQAILANQRTIVADAFQAPKTETEQTISQIWRDVLGEVQFGTKTSVFEIGGDSLNATQIVSRIREKFGVSLPLPSIFEEARTVSGMAKLVEMLQHRAPEATQPKLQPVRRERKLVASFGQEQLWILDQMEPGTSLYNVSRAVELVGRLDESALEKSLNHIVARHEVLRTNLVFDSGLHQVIKPSAPQNLRRLDLSMAPVENRQKLALAAAENEAGKAFNLSKDHLFRSTLIALGPEEHVLVLTFHQTVIDGWSVDIVLQELKACYEAFSQRQNPPLAALPVQYADFAEWQRRSLSAEAAKQQVNFWKQQLSGNLPSFRFGGATAKKGASHHARVERLDLSPALLAKLREFNRRNGSTLFMTLLAGYKLLLAQCSKQNEILIGAPKNIRNEPDLEKLAGFFVNTLVLRTKLNPQDSFEKFVGSIRTNAVKAFANSDVPFQKVAQEMRAGGQTSLFQVWFGAIDSLQPFAMNGVRATPRFLSPGTAQFDLAVFVSERTDGVACLFEYKTEMFNAEAVKGLMHQFVKILETALDDPSRSVADLLNQA